VRARGRHLWYNFRMSMKEQLSLAATGFERHAKTTRRTKFLLEMDGSFPGSACERSLGRFTTAGKAWAGGRSIWSG
jgi:hypothetical protein